MKRLLRRIRAIARQHPKHYFGRLWHWAVKPGYAGKRKRFKALISWARDHYALAHSLERKHMFWKAAHAYHRKRRLLKKHHHPNPPPVTNEDRGTFGRAGAPSRGQHQAPRPNREPRRLLLQESHSG